MKTFLVALVGVLIGGAIGGYLAFTSGAGAGAGGEVITGARAGACLVVEAAKDDGLIGPDQVDGVLGAAAMKLVGGGPVPTVARFVDGDAECAPMVAQLQAAVAESRTQTP
ncbi:MAG: hypothetical protein AAFX81_08875 [Pseudomonadota bacterium]